MSDLRTVRTVADLTGPRGLPLFGNLPELRFGRDGHRAFERWADRYGPTYVMRFGRYPVVVTGDGPTVAAALRDRPDGFRRTGVNRIFRDLGLDGVFNAEGDRWRRLRKMAAQSLNAAYLREYFASITRSATRLQARWAVAAFAGRPVDVLDDMMRFTLDVTTALAIGHDLNSLEADGDGLHSRMAELFPEIGRRIQAPFPHHGLLRLPRDRRRESAVREVDALIRVKHAEALARSGPPSTFLEALVAAGDEFTHEELRGNVLTMLVAGEDTTSSAAAWTLHYLATHPQAQARVREEALTAFGAAGLPSDPAALRQLEFAEACVNEAMRLRPIAPNTGVRALRDTVLPGTHADLRVPRGTDLLLMLSYGGRAVPEPDSFRPERWLGDAPPQAAAPLLPFGAGPRFCPGRNLALLEATLVAALMCRDFTLAPGAGDVGEKLAFAAFPTNLRLRLAPSPANA